MNKYPLYLLGLLALLVSCNPSKSIHKISVPTNASMAITIPSKKEEMTEFAIQKWPQANLVTDSIPGISIDKAYEFLADKKATTIIVGVIDSGIDITHIDLKDNIWTNTDEIPNNGIDDDNNGYIDDINGWNFLGGKKGNASPEQLELTRLYSNLNKKYSGVSAEGISKEEQKEFAFYKEIETEFEEAFKEVTMNVTFFKDLLESVLESDAYAKKIFNKSDYTLEELKSLPEGKISPYLIKIVNADKSVSEFVEKLKEGLDYYQQQANYNYNVDFNGRKSNGDNVYDINDISYGNGHVLGSLEKEMHGTHVSGIALASRNNGTKMQGVAQNVKLLAVRAIPDGDEYDKDVALAIRYAVNNGAKVINMSFGKTYSPNAEWVYDALKYAEKKDVLLVHAAGNDSKNIDKESNFPTDSPDKIVEIVDNVITVGSITRYYNENLVSSF